MDPAEQSSDKTQNNENNEHAKAEERTDDPTRTADNGAEKSGPSSEGKESLPTPPSSHTDVEGLAGAANFPPRAQRPPMRSPARLHLQEAYNNTSDSSPKINNSSQSSTLSPSPTPTGAVNNDTESKKTNDTITETIQNAVNDMQQMLSLSISTFQAQMDLHSKEIDDKLSKQETHFNDVLKRSQVTQNKVPPPPQDGGPPPLQQGAENARRAPAGRMDRLKDQIAEINHLWNSRASTTRRHQGEEEEDPSGDEVDDQGDDFDRYHTPFERFTDRFASVNQRFSRAVPPPPPGPTMSPQQLNPRVDPFVPRNAAESKYLDPGRVPTRDPFYRPHISMQDGNTVLNNSIGSVNISSRPSNYYNHDVNSTNRSARRYTGQSFMGRPGDDVNNVNNLVNRTFKAIEDRQEYLGEEIKRLTPEQIKTRSENLRRLNPMTILNTSAKGLKTLTKTLATFNPWKDWWEHVFRSCHLECITMMERRLSPTNREGWEELDRSQQSSRARALTYNSIAYHGIPPTCSKVHDTFAELNGIFLGVIDAFPTLMMTLLTLMKSSIDSTTMKHISHYKVADSVSLRSMYFKALMTHTNPLSDTRKAALRDFMQSTKYDTTMSPLEFLEKTIIRAEQVDAIFDREQVNDEMLWTVTMDAIEEAVGDRYDNIIDAHCHSPGYDTHDRNVLFNIFVQMDNKYKKKRKSNKSQYAMIADDGATDDFETANYAGSGRRDNKRHGDVDRKPASELPCFQMQRHGKCSYKNCKFSHNKQVLASAPPPPPTPENVALMADQLADLQQALAAVSAKYKKTKNWKKKFSKKKVQPDKKSKRITSDPSIQTYQGVTGTAKANAAIDHSQDPNVDSPQIALIEKENVEDLDGDDVVNDSSDESTTESSSDQE